MGKARQRSWGLVAVVTVVLLLAVGAFAFLKAGIYNVAADDPHYPLTTALLEQVREASIHARAGRLTSPKDLMTEARIVQGAGNYNAMCTQCHLAPGMQPTELSRGLYPAPPDLTEHSVDAAEAFWVIKHGIKSTGMPAWGESMDDEYIWNMAAFLQRLPELDAAAYRTLVGKSDGHSHGGGESTPHDHGAMPDAAEAAADHPHAPGTPPHHDQPSNEPAGHPHAPGTPAHDDSPAHVDPPGTPAHSH
jgi:mono/diheme cytochrome c family protein